MGFESPRAARRRIESRRLEECVRRTEVLVTGVRLMADARARRDGLRAQFFAAHDDAMRAVAAHDGTALWRAIARENEAIADQALLVKELRLVAASASGEARSPPDGED